MRVVMQSCSLAAGTKPCTAGPSESGHLEIRQFGQIPDPTEGFSRFFSDDYEEVMAISEAIAGRGGQASKR